MKRELTLLLVCLFASIGLLNAQTSKVTGIVIYEEDKEPVVGASVMIKGTNLGTVTNLDGEFVLQNVPSSARTWIIL